MKLGFYFIIMSIFWYLKEVCKGRKIAFLTMAGKRQQIENPDALPRMAEV